MSRAAVERTPGREVRPGVSASTWWTSPDLRARQEAAAYDRPPAQAGALFRREDIDAAVARGAMLRGTFSNRAPSQAMTVGALREMERFLATPSDDRTDALAFAWQAIADARRRADAVEARREALRRAVERTGRALVAWLIGRWRR